MDYCFSLKEIVKRQLMIKFKSQKKSPLETSELIRSHFTLLDAYLDKGVDSKVAVQRTIDHQERWNLLLDFERQTLSPEIAEGRVDAR